MTMIDTQERRDYYEETSGAARALATSHPVALWVPFAALWFVGAVVCGILTYWWTAIPIAAVGALHLLPLRWNLRHRDDAQNAVRLRRNAVHAGFRAHPVRAVATMAIIVCVYTAVRTSADHTARGWWVLLWAGIAALVAMAVGIWEVRRARRTREQ